MRTGVIIKSANDPGVCKLMMIALRVIRGRDIFMDIVYRSV